MNWEHVIEIQQAVNRYFRALDEKDLDAAHLRRILTDDARVIFQQYVDTAKLLDAMGPK